MLFPQPSSWWSGHLSCIRSGAKEPLLDLQCQGTALQASRHMLLSWKRCLPNFKFLVGSSVRTENLVGCRLDHIAHFSGIIELSEGVTFMGLDSSQGHGLMSRKLSWSPVPSPYAQLWKELAFEFRLSASAYFKTSSFLPSHCRVRMLTFVPQQSLLFLVMLIVFSDV